MPATVTHRAREFVQAARRSEPPRRTRSGSGTPASGRAALATGKEKAAVVGLHNSTLLAQLVAKKKVPDPQRLFDGYDLYFDTLSRIGWAVQDKGFAVYVEQSQNYTRPRGHHEGGRHPAGAHSHQLGRGYGV